MRRRSDASSCGARNDRATHGEGGDVHLGDPWKSLGFRFLRSAGLDDPLVVYENAFSRIGDESTAISRAADKVALRFPDPDERRDAAGRVIPHDFVLIGRWADGVTSAADGIRLVWPLVADEFERVWDSSEPPSADR